MADIILEEKNKVADTKFNLKFYNKLLGSFRGPNFYIE